MIIIRVSGCMLLACDAWAPITKRCSSNSLTNSPIACKGNDFVPTSSTNPPSDDSPSASSSGKLLNRLIKVI